jgi:hypothetical protein
MAGCIFSTARTPERDALFKWVGPTDEAEWVLLGRADHSFQLRSLEDARPLRIGTYNGRSTRWCAMAPHGGSTASTRIRSRTGQARRKCANDWRTLHDCAPVCAT